MKWLSTHQEIPVRESCGQIVMDKSIEIITAGVAVDIYLMSKLPVYGSWLQQHPLLYTLASEFLLSKGSNNLPQLENTFIQGGEWLCLCCVHVPCTTQPLPLKAAFREYCN